MSGGIFALLDDVAVLARMSAAASTKAAGVVVDDMAVTPQYVHGVTSDRELPIIKKIAIGWPAPEPTFLGRFAEDRPGGWSRACRNCSPPSRYYPSGQDRRRPPESDRIPR